MINTSRDHEIKSIEFDLMTERDIKAISAHCITESTLYKKGVVPNINGPNSLKLGSTGSHFLCMTCYNDNRMCTGHPGHIELHRYIYHPCLINSVLKCLRCVCYFCSEKICSKKMDSKKRKRSQLNSLVMNTKNKKVCSKCGGTQPTYSKSSHSITCVFDLDLIENEDEKCYLAKQTFTAEKAKQILTHVSESTAESLGVRNPQAMILSAILVPPPHIRPSVRISFNPSKNKGQDFLTTRIQDIVKINNHIRKSTDPEQTEKLVENLFFVVKSYMDKTDISKISGGNKMSCKFKSIITRLKGKRGRVRGNIQGKRVDFSSRSVITPDCSINVWELGVPRVIAMKQTVRVTIYPLNISEMRERVVNGGENLFGCTTLVDPHDRHYNVSTMSQDQRVEMSKKIKKGWKIDRFLQDGDFVCFNRQPTLHKSSIMGHSVVILDKGKSFRLNTGVCRPYNADFDGKHLFFFFDLIVYILTLSHIHFPKATR